MQRENTMMGKITERLREVVGIILLVGSVGTFIVTYRNDFQLISVVSAIIFLITLIASSIYVVLAKTPPMIHGGNGINLYSEKWRGVALTCLGGAIGITLAYGVFDANRTYIVEAFAGTKPPTSASGILTCTDYDIRIVSPQSGEKVLGTFTVRGTYVNMPPEDSILLLLKSSAGDYFPQEKVKIDLSERTWQGKVNRDTGQEFIIIVSIMGRNGRALFSYFNKVGREAERWPAIEELTNDILECDRVSIE